MAARGSPEWRLAISRGMAGRHSTRGNPKLTPHQRERLAARLRAGESVKAVAARFGLSVRWTYQLRLTVIKQ